MFGKKFRPFVIPSIYVLLVVLFALFGILLNESLKVVENKDDNNLTYVSYEVLLRSSLVRRSNMRDNMSFIMI